MRPRHLNTGYVAGVAGMLFIGAMNVFDWPAWLTPLSLLPLALAVFVAIVEDSRAELDARRRKRHEPR